MKQLLVCLLSFSTLWAAEHAITVEDRVVGSVDARLFGQFMELVGGQEQGPDAAVDPATGRLRPEVDAMLRALDLPILRYPGGGKVESPGYRWTQLIDGPHDGDPSNRRRHAFGLHEFLDWCEVTGTEPILVTKLADIVRGILPVEEIRASNRAMMAYVCLPDRGDLPPELRTWVELRIANGRREPWGVRYWQIGNEFTWVAVERLRKQGMADDEIARRYVEACGQVIGDLRAIRPDIETLVEINMEDPRVGLPVCDLLAAELGDQVQHWTTHRYWSWAIDRVERDGQALWPGVDFSREDYWRTVVSAGAKDARGMTCYDSPMLRKAMEHGYPLAMTEWNWNSWWALEGRGERPRPFAEPLWAKGVASASMLHGFMNAAGRISIGTQSMLLGTSWDLRAIDVADGHCAVHPSGRILGLYRRHHGPEVLAWRGDIPTYAQPFTLGQLEPAPAVALVDLLVTRSQERLFLHMINRDFHRDHELVVDVGDIVDAGIRQAFVHRITGTLDDGPLRAAGYEVASQGTSVLRRGSGDVWRVPSPARSVQIVEIPLPR